MRTGARQTKARQGELRRGKTWQGGQPLGVPWQTLIPGLMAASCCENDNLW